jgi:hypothetical protein
MKNSLLLLMAAFCSTCLFANETAWYIASPEQPMKTKEWSATRDPNDITYRREAANTRNAERFSLMTADITPLQISIITPVELPWGDWDVRGIRLNAIYGRARNVTGLDLGLWNAATESMTGLQVGVANTGAYTRGLQAGAINCASRLKGLQIGLINYADSAAGLQIGLINVISDSSWPFSPILNMCFY